MTDRTARQAWIHWGVGLVLAAGLLVEGGRHLMQRREIPAETVAGVEEIPLSVALAVEPAQPGVQIASDTPSSP